MTPQEAMEMVRELVVLAKENMERMDAVNVDAERLAARVLDLDDFFRERGMGGFVSIVERGLR